MTSIKASIRSHLFVRSIAALLMLLVTELAQAHQGSTSYLQLRSEGLKLYGHWDIALRDLDTAIGLDADGDGALTWGEVQDAQVSIISYALAHLSISGNRDACELKSDALQITEHNDGNYAALTLSGYCAQPPRDLEVRYTLLFDIDAMHRGLLNLDFQGGHSAIFSPERMHIEFGAESTNANIAVDYFRAGIFHVWTGFDHLLFLIGLFLPAVLRRRDGVWVAASAFSLAFREVVILASLFTLAHAITLTLSALGIVALPTRWVEAAVAATVLFTGINNLWPMVYRGLRVLAIGFGLIHGAAIAGVLTELGLPLGNRLLALATFNAGVEIAQLLFLAGIMVPYFITRNQRWYRRWMFVPTSTCIAAIGFLWLLQRTFSPPFF